MRWLKWTPLNISFSSRRWRRAGGQKIQAAIDRDGAYQPTTLEEAYAAAARCPEYRNRLLIAVRDALHEFLRDGTEERNLEFFSGEISASWADGEEPAGSTLLARLYVMPHSPFRVIPDICLRSGVASWARIVGPLGDGFVFPLSEGGWFAFNTLDWRKGGPVSVGDLSFGSPQDEDQEERAPPADVTWTSTHQD